MIGRLAPGGISMAIVSSHRSDDPAPTPRRGAKTQAKTTQEKASSQPQDRSIAADRAEDALARSSRDEEPLDVVQPELPDQPLSLVKGAKPRMTIAAPPKKACGPSA